MTALGLRTRLDRVFGGLNVLVGGMFALLCWQFLPDPRTGLVADLSLAVLGVLSARLVVSGCWMLHPRGVVRVDGGSIVIDRPAVFVRPVTIAAGRITSIEQERTGYGPIRGDGFAGVFPVTPVVEIHLAPPLRMVESRDTIAFGGSGFSPVPPRRRRDVTSVLCAFVDGEVAVAELRRWHRSAIDVAGGDRRTVEPGSRRGAALRDHRWLATTFAALVAVAVWYVAG